MSSPREILNTLAVLIVAGLLATAPVVAGLGPVVGTAAAQSANAQITGTIQVDGEDPGNALDVTAFAVDRNNDTVPNTETTTQTADNGDFTVDITEDDRNEEVVFEISGEEVARTAYPQDTLTKDVGTINISASLLSGIGVSIVDTNSPVLEGDQLTADIDVTNNAQSAVSNTEINLTFDNTQRDSTTLDLAAGETQQITLSFVTADDAADISNPSITVNSPDNSDTQSVTIQDRQPPNFTVDIERAPAEVTAGDSVEVEANITNTGDPVTQGSTPTQTITLNDTGFDGETVDSTDVTLASGESQTPNLTWNTQNPADIGTGDLTVSSENESATTSVTVNRPAGFQIEDLTASPDPANGENEETITVDFTVNNTGGASDEQTIDFLVNNTVRDSTTVQLNANQKNTSLSFETTAERADAPALNLRVESEDSSGSTTVPVEIAEFNITVDAEPPAEITEGDSVSINTTVENIGAVTGTQDIVFNKTGAGTDDSTVKREQLTPGQTTTANFSTNNTATTGSIDLSVSTLDDSVTRVVTVDEGQVSVTIDEVTDPVTEGGTVDINTTVTNTQASQVSQQITLTTNGTGSGATRSESVTLDPDESTPVDFSYTTVEGDAPAISVEVASDDDTASRAVTVNRPANFDVTIENVEDGVTAGVGNISVDYTVENTGQTSAEQTIRFSVNGTQRDTASVSLPAGDSKGTQTFEYATDRDDDPFVTVEVASDDDTATEQATVNPSSPPFFRFTKSTLNTSVTTGEDIVATYTIENNGTFADTQTLRVTAENSTEEIFSETPEQELNGTATGSETVTDSFTIPSSAADTPEITVTAETANDSREAVVDVLETGELVIDDFSSDPTDEAVVGEVVEFDGEINNTGDLSNSTDVELLNETGTVLDSSGVSVGGGQTKTVSFGYQLQDSDNKPGDTNFTLSINNQNTNDTLGINVTKPEAVFEIEGTTVTDPTGNASSGDRVTVEATINNTGTGDGKLGVSLNGSYSTEVDSRTTVSLAPDESPKTVALTSDQIPASAEGTNVDFTVATPSDESVKTVGVDESADFTADIETAPGSVTAGTEFEIEPNITNIGDERGEKRVTVRLGGVKIGSKQYDLAAGDHSTANITLQTELSDAGENLDLTLRTPDDSANTKIDVNKPAAFEITDTQLSPSEPVQGEQELEATVTVENTGDLEGTTDITVNADGADPTETTETITGGSSESVALNLSTGDIAAGGQSVLITAEEAATSTVVDSTTETTTVREPADISVGIDSVTNPVIENNVLEARATLRNDGDVSGTETVEFSFSGTERASKTDITVPADGSKKVTFDSFKPASTGDNQQVKITAGGSSATRSIEVLGTEEVNDAAEFQIKGLTVNDKTRSDDVLRDGDTDSGAHVFYNVSVENIGGTAGERDIVFYDATSDQVLNSFEDFSLSPGQTKPAKFGIDPDNLRSGDRTLGVGAIQNDNLGSSQNETITVRDLREEEFEVEINGDVDNIARGDTVSATVNNTGDIKGSPDTATTFELVVDGEVLTRKKSTNSITAGGSRTLDLTVPNEPRAGNFSGELQIESEDDSASADTTIDFGTVTNAVNAASTGDTVTLAAETYTSGPITIDTAVTVDGAEAIIKNTTTISASDSVTLRGVEFRDVDTALKINRGATDSKITNTRFGPSVDYGINTSADDVTITNNEFIENTRAIDLKKSTRAQVLRNNIIDSQTGINATGDSRFNDHTIVDNNIEPADVAIRATGLDQNGGQINATNNWWGRPGGPIDGQEILSPVDFSNWKGEAAEEPNYQIDQTNLTNLDAVTEGEQVSIDATVNNTGGTTGDTADRLVLELAGTEVDSIPFDDTTTEARALQFTPSEADAKGYDAADLTLSTSDDSVTKSVNVNTAPAFTVNITSAPDKDSDETLSVTAEIDNTGEAGGNVTSTLFFDGNNSDSTTINIAGEGSGTVTLERDLSASDEGTNIPIEVTAGTSSDTATVDVEEPPSGGDPPGGGGGGGGGAAPAPPTGDEGPPTIQDVRSTLNLVSPSSDTTTDIVDGVARPEGTATVREISFQNQAATGSVAIREYSNPPQQIRTQIAESVTAAGAIDTGEDNGTVSTLSVSDITPSDEATADSAATVTLTVPADEVTNPQQLTVVKETYDFEAQEETWTALSTEVQEVTDEEVTVTAEADSFSLFTVVETQQDGDQQPSEDDGQQQDDGQQDDGQQEDDGGATGIIVIVVLLLLAIGGAVLYARNNDIDLGGGNNS